MESLRYFEWLAARVVSLESAAVVCGLASAWYSKNRSVLVFPSGIIATAISIYLCIEHRIYADTIVLLMFLIMSVYGWWRWSSGKHVDDRVVVAGLSPVVQIGFAAVSLLLWAAIYFALALGTNSTVPVLDSFTTSFSIVWMILMAEKRVENWVYWIVVDAASTIMFWSKGLELMALQYLLFCWIAVLGYRSWKAVAYSGSSACLSG